MSEEFHFHGPLRDPMAMRAALSAALGLVLGGCSLVGSARPGPDLPAGGPADRVVRFAAAQIGKRYCWGGIGPECFDCSGLVQQSWRSAGVHLPRTADAIALAEPEVPMEQARTGDVLWWPGHVGIYAGKGWVIDAYDTRHGVVMRRPVVRPRRALRPAGSLSHPAPLSQGPEQGFGGSVDGFRVGIEDDVPGAGAGSDLDTVFEPGD
jgi:hypothetical protein